MISKIVILLILCCCRFVVPDFAQAKHPKHGRKNAAAASASSANAFPVLTTSLGNVLSNALPKSKMQALLDSSLVVRDQHNNLYTVVNFEFGYRRSDTVTDSTGKPALAVDYISWNFSAARLDSLWRARVKAEVGTGDQLFFDNVIAEGEDGKKYKSSSLKFTVR